MDTATNDPTQASRADVPSWLHRLAAIGWRVLVTVALGILVVGLALYLSTVTLSVLFAVIAVATLGPLQERLLARGWGRAKASGGALGLALVVLVLALGLVLLALVPALVDLAKVSQAGVAQIEDWMVAAGLPVELSGVVQSIVTQIQTWLTEQGAAIVGSIATIATIVMLGLFLTFYFLLDGQKGWDVGLRDLRSWRRDRIRGAGEEAMRRAGGYVRGTALIAAINALASFFALAALGVPGAGPLAVLVLVAGFIPYVGVVFASTIVLLAGLVAGGPLTPLLLLAFLVLINLAEHRWLEPSVRGRTLDMHPAVVLIALLVGFAFGGIVGMFVAVPTVAIVSAVAGAVIDALGTRDADEAAVSASIPEWLDRLAQWSWRLLVGGAFLWLGVLVASQIPVVIAPIVVAITLAATFLPGVRALEARGWSRARASLVISIVLWVTVTIVTVVSIAALGGPMADAVQGASAGASVADDSLPSGVSGAVGGLTGEIGSGILENLISIVAELAAIIVFLVLSALLSFFLLRDGNQAWDWFTAQIGGWREREVRLAGDKAVTMLGGYMYATGVLGLFNAVTGFVIMTLLGLPLALPVAILSFFGGFIPYIGQFITSAIAFLVAVAFGSTQDIIFMAIWTAVFNIVQGSVIAPLVYGRAVSLHPAVVLIVIPAGGELAGILGMFLAVPLTGILGAVWRHILTAIGEIPPADTAEIDDPIATDPSEAAAAIPPVTAQPSPPA